MEAILTLQRVNVPRGKLQKAMEICGILLEKEIMDVKSFQSLGFDPRGTRQAEFDLLKKFGFIKEINGRYSLTEEGKEFARSSEKDKARILKEIFKKYEILRYAFDILEKEPNISSSNLGKKLDAKFWSRTKKGKHWSDIYLQRIGNFYKEYWNFIKTSLSKEKKEISKLTESKYEREDLIESIGEIKTALEFIEINKQIFIQKINRSIEIAQNIDREDIKILLETLKLNLEIIEKKIGFNKYTIKLLENDIEAMSKHAKEYE